MNLRRLVYGAFSAPFENFTPQSASMNLTSLLGIHPSSDVGPPHPAVPFLSPLISSSIWLFTNFDKAFPERPSALPFPRKLSRTNFLIAFSLLSSAGSTSRVFDLSALEGVMPTCRTNPLWEFLPIGICYTPLLSWKTQNHCYSTTLSAWCQTNAIQMKSRCESRRLF